MKKPAISRVYPDDRLSHGASGSVAAKHARLTSERHGFQSRPEDQFKWIGAAGNNADPDRNPGIEPRSSDHSK
jgi:hypothetical protein